MKKNRLDPESNISVWAIKFNKGWFQKVMSQGALSEKWLLYRKKSTHAQTLASILKDVLTHTL